MFNKEIDKENIFHQPHTLEKITSFDRGGGKLFITPAMLPRKKYYWRMAFIQLAKNLVVPIITKWSLFRNSYWKN